ncbi:MAG: formimidoylglutamate deiminase [Pseudomonadota bacterium]
MPIAIHAEQALLPGGWAPNVRVTLSGAQIAMIERDTAAPGDVRVARLLPALGDVHADPCAPFFAALAPDAAPASAAWRQVEAALGKYLTPDDQEAAAAHAQVTALEAGFAAVGAFHRHHHGAGSRPKAYGADGAAAITAAAALTGVGLTLLPVLRSYGGPSQAPLTPADAPFACDPDSYLALLDCARDACQGLPKDSRVGMGVESLSATWTDDLSDLIDAVPDGPIHLPIARHGRDVTDGLGAYGARPVEWLLNLIGVDERWCLLHATAMTPAETAGLAASGAVAGSCPMLEACAGWGPFDGPAYRALGGRFALGTGLGAGPTSEVTVSSLLGSALGPTETSEAVYASVADGSAQALGRNGGQITPGSLADLVSLAPGQGLVGSVDTLWSAGREVVAQGRHPARDTIAARFQSALARLRAAI